MSSPLAIVAACLLPVLAAEAQRMGDGMYRKSTMRAVNVFAGNELLADQGKHALTDPAKAEKALAEIPRKAETLKPPADKKTEERWIRVLGDAPEYAKLPEPELLVVGVIAAPAEDSPNYIMVDNPWLPVFDMREIPKPFAELRGRQTLAEFNHTRILMKARIRPKRPESAFPEVVVGWMRAIRADEADYQMPLPVNVALLPDKAHPFAIQSIFACEAVQAADSALGFSGVQDASQRFKVLEVFRGDAKVGEEFELSYSYLAPGMGFGWAGRDVARGERVIWITNGDGAGCGALADTPHNRQAARDLAARTK